MAWERRRDERGHLVRAADRADRPGSPLGSFDSRSGLWRTSVLLLALAAASCTPAGSSGEVDRPTGDSTRLATTGETLPPVKPADPVVSDEVKTASPIEPESFGPIFDRSTDPFFQRQSRPILAADPTDTWSVVVDRATVPFVESVGEVIVARTITPDDNHAIVGFHRLDGTVAWEFDPDERIGRVSVVGGGVLVTLNSATGERAVLLDGATGGELPLPSDDNLSPRGRFVGAVTVGTCSVRNYNPLTGELIGEFCPVGAGPETYVARVDDSVVELDPLDFRPLSDPIPIGKISEQRRVLVFGDTVVTYSLSELNLLDRGGDVLVSLPNPGEIMLTAAGVGSDMLIVYDFDVAVGLDVQTLTPVWERRLSVDPFGVVDGEVFGTARGESSTEVFSLETGETRCVVDADVVSAQNGFYERDGVAYDFDCAQRWVIDVGDDVEIHFVDAGIVTVERTSADETTIRLLS